MTTKKDGAGAAGGTQALRVVARRDSFRRAGYAFSAEPRTIPLAELTKEQINMLRNDPLLVVMDVELPEEPGTPASAK